MGNNVGRTYPTIDNYDADTGTIMSVKSRDITSVTYQNPSNLQSTIKNDINTLASISGGPGILPGDIQNRVLNVVVPDVPLSAGQLDAIANANSYAASKGVSLIITVGR